MNQTRRWTLAATSSAHARDRTDHPAIICEDRTVTYRELHLASNRIAHALRCAGVGRRTRVGYLARESEHYYAAILACAKLGAVLVPVNWRLTADEVDHILRDSGAELLFVESDFWGVVEGVRADLAGLRDVVRLDEPGDRDHGSGLRAWSASAVESDVDDGAGPDDAVVQIYTSGTTGLPKGVVLANRAFFTLPAAMRDARLSWIDWLPDDVNLISLPGLGIAGIGWFMHGFNAGATNVVMRFFQPQEAVRLVRTLGVTTTFAAPAMLQMMLAERGVTRETFASLRKIAYGAAPISEALLRRCLDMFACEFGQIYSSTEAGSVAVCLPPEAHKPGSPLLRAAGKACPGNELKVIDQNGRMLPPGQIGQVCIRTPARMLGYWNKPEATARTIIDGWLHMGDAGYLDENGYLYLCDRINDTIIVAGQNIYPAEVEKQLGDHPAVADVAVVGMPDPRWGEAVHACVVLRPGASVTPRELMLFLRRPLADYKIPTAYHFATDLPRNPSGKVLRREVRTRLLAEASSTEPRTVGA
ncbi:MAG: long-chain-fatty-acid--CoA ligase [Pseudonocardiales bacterium]